jgi:hypothetical protein
LKKIKKKNLSIDFQTGSVFFYPDARSYPSTTRGRDMKPGLHAAIGNHTDSKRRTSPVVRSRVWPWGCAGSWVFNNDNGSASNCSNNCANNCANNVQNNSAFRSAVVSLPNPPVTKHQFCAARAVYAIGTKLFPSYSLTRGDRTAELPRARESRRGSNPRNLWVSSCLNQYPEV